MNDNLKNNYGKTARIQLKLTRKQIWSITVKIFVVLVLLVGMGYAGWFTGDSLKYDTKLGIEYTGGYQIQANVFDYTKDKGNVDYDKPNGDAKQGLKILQQKLDPIGDQPISLQTYGGHTVAVRASQSMYKTKEDFANAVNRMGAIFIMVNGTKDNADSDVLLTKSKDDSGATKYTRTQIHDVFTGVTSTIDRNRMPVVQLDKNADGQWDKIAAAQKDKQIWFWSDLGQLIDALRNDFNNYSYNQYEPAIDSYTAILNKWSVITKNTDQVQSQNKLFAYTGVNKEGKDFSGNFLTAGAGAFNLDVFKEVKTAQSFKWDVPSSKLMVNPNETEPQSDEVSYVVPFEPYARQFYAEGMPPDVRKLVKSYVFNFDAIDPDNTNSNYNVSSGNVFSVKSQTESLKISNLIQGGLSGIVLQSINVQTINSVISSTALKALEIVLGVILIIAAVVLIFYERLYGILVIITFVSSIFMVLYIVALLNVQISPITIAALVVGFGLILFGLFVMIKRYRDEKVRSGLPIVTSIKIAIKQTLPMFVDAIVLFLVLGLSLFWAGAGEIKAFAIALLITLFVTIVLMVCLYLLFLYLLISIGTLDKFQWLDISHFSLQEWWVKRGHKPLFAKKIESDDENIHDHAALQMQTNDLALNAPASQNVMMAEAAVNNGGKVQKIKGERRHLNLYDYARWSPLVALILIVVALAVAFSGAANFDQTIRQGSVFTISQNVFPSPEHDESEYVLAQKEIDLINKSLRSDEKGKMFEKYDIQMSINGPVSVQTSGYSVIVWTNITDHRVGNKFVSWLLSISNNPLSTDDVVANTSEPVIANELMVMVIIALAIALIFVFIYTFFRLDWVQFISIFGSAILAVAVCLSIAIIVHILITFNMIVVFAAIYSFAIVTSTLIMSKAKQKKKLFNLIDYDEFFNYEYNHRKSVKLIRHQIHYLTHNQIKARAKLLRSEDEYLTKRESIKLAKNDILLDREQLEASAQKARAEYKLQRKDFKAYNHKHNFLYKAAGMTVRDLLTVSILMSIVLVVVCVFLAAFGGSSFGFFIILLIGILLAIWTPFLIAIPIWVILEKYRALNRVRVNNFLDSQRVDLDEQIVVGVND